MILVRLDFFQACSPCSFAAIANFLAGLSCEGRLNGIDIGAYHIKQFILCSVICGIKCMGCIVARAADAWRIRAPGLPHTRPTSFYAAQVALWLAR